jgi:hypothetical protein
MAGIRTTQEKAGETKRIAPTYSMTKKSALVGANGAPGAIINRRPKMGAAMIIISGPVRYGQ